MPTSHSESKTRRCYYCDALLEDRAMVQGPGQLMFDIGLGDIAKEVRVPAERCPKCQALQPWAHDLADAQKSETD